MIWHPAIMAIQAGTPTHRALSRRASAPIPSAAHPRAAALNASTESPTVTIPIKFVMCSLALFAGQAVAQMTSAPDPHVGHAMPAPADPHAGHQMATPSGANIDAAMPERAPASNPHAGHAMSPAPLSIREANSAHNGMEMRAGVDSASTTVAFTLEQPMILRSVKLANAAGQRIPLPTTLSDAPVSVYRASVIRLSSGTYNVT